MIKLSYRLIFSMLLMLCQILSFRQNMVFSQTDRSKIEHISVNEGLSQSTVFCILQDSQGFMWFGTRTGGLNKYDGYSFTHYKKDPNAKYSIGGNELLSLYEDSKGIIWVGTRSEGLSKFDSQTERFYNYYFDEDDSNSISDNTINATCEDSRGRIWVGTNIGLCVYNSEKNNFTRFNNSLTDDAFGHILSIKNIGEDLILLASKSSGIFLFNTESGKIIKDFTHDSENSSSISDNYVTAILYDSKGRVWAGTRENGISRLNNLKSNEFTNFVNDINNKESLTDNIIRTLHEDKNHNIWIGTKEGLDLLSPEQQEKDNPVFIHFKNDVQNENSLNQNSIYSFCEDSAGNFWIGTWSGGINYLISENQKFEHFKHKNNNINSLSFDAVSSFAITDQGIWVGTEGGGLNLFNRNLNKFTHYRQDINDTNSLRSDHVKSLFVDKDGDLWVGTFNGLHLFDKGKGQFKHFLDGASIYSIEAGINDEIWIGSSKELYKLNKNTNKITTYRNSTVEESSISNNSINIVYKDKNNDLWIGTKRGLNYYNRADDNFTRYIYSRIDIKSISNDFVTSINEDYYGNLWIGTIDGLNRFDTATKSFVLYGEKDGLPDNVIYNILGDNRGNLWFTTNRGLTKLNSNLSAENTVTSNNKKGLTIRNYDIGDGLQGNEFIMNSSYKSVDGEFFLGGTNGFNIFHPEQIKDNKQIPKVVISDFKLFNKSVEIGAKNSPLKKHISQTDRLKLNYKQSVFTFEFVALNFISPEKNQYAYKMEGFDDEWILAGNNRQASYTNLPAGDYIFKVKASNNDGIWNEEGTSIKLKVRPPWWKTIIFYLMVLALVSGAVYYFIKAREQQIKNDKKKLEEELKEGKQELEQQQSKVKQHEEEILRRNIEEQEIRFTNEGIAKFSDILSAEGNNLHELAQTIISEMVKYVGGVMGVLYISPDENSEEEKFLELYGGYAIDENVLIDKRVSAGEGYIGTCFTEGKTNVINNVPEDYFKLSSGLGEVLPKTVYIIPILQGSNIQGVIEIASLNTLENYKVQFIEKIGESITSVIAIRKASERMNILLEQSHQQAEELRSQEEEVRQNLEEMHATQEEMQRTIEEHQDLQEELNRAKVFLDALMDNLSDYYYFKDDQSRFIRISKSMLPLFPYDTIEEMVGKTDYDFHKKDFADEFFAEEKKIMDTNKGFSNKELHEVTQNGKDQWVLVTKLPLTDKSGKCIGTYGVSKDISELKNLQLHNEQLKEEITKLNALLKPHLDSLPKLEKDKK
jgi:PAS domain S-box-containing protein